MKLAIIFACVIAAPIAAHAQQDKPAYHEEETQVFRQKVFSGGLASACPFVEMMAYRAMGAVVDAVSSSGQTPKEVVAENYDDIDDEFSHNMIDLAASYLSMPGVMEQSSDKDGIYGATAYNACLQGELQP